MPRIGRSELSEFIEEILLEMGAHADVAETVADALVEADLNGHHSHGVRMIPTYFGRVREGTIDPSARPEIVQEDAAALTIDGNATFGQYVGQMAVERGVSMADSRGVALVGIRNATHLGCIGTWARRTTAKNLAFLGFVCNPTSTHVAPPGTATGRLSTNPISMALPSFDALPYPLVLDMATSQVAFGKIGEAAADGDLIPDEWTGPYEGKPDPEGVLDGPGALLPLGGSVSGYKGFGLAAMIELLASTVADSEVSGEADAAYGNIATFVFIDPLAFTTKERVKERITAFREYVLSGEPIDGLAIGDAAMGDELGLPGKPEYDARTEQSTEGVDIRAADARSLRDVAVELGLDELASTLVE